VSEMTSECGLLVGSYWQVYWWGHTDRFIGGVILTGLLVGHTDRFIGGVILTGLLVGSYW